MSGEMHKFTFSELNDQFDGNHVVSSSQESITPSLQAWMIDQVNAILGPNAPLEPGPPLEPSDPLELNDSLEQNAPLDPNAPFRPNATVWPMVEDCSPSLEEVRQTNINIDARPDPGPYKFNFQIEDSNSKQYTFSEKLNRLYCVMDKAVPINFKWEGPNISHIRAMLVFKDPDHINSPVFRCRTHNDENCDNNRGCKHYRHIVRCDNENTYYKENVNSRRHSVVTFLSSNPNGWDGAKGLYRFMCNTTCNGVDAIARRRTDLILTLESSNHDVVGRAVVGVKICSCPHRDKRRDEEEGEGRKKRKSEPNHIDSKKKREHSNIIDVPPSVVPPPLLNTPDNVPRQMIKKEVEGEASDYMDLQISIPNFPCSKLEEFQSAIKRLVASYYITDEDVDAATSGLRFNEI